MEGGPNPLSESEVLEVDATYRPVPDFEAWPDEPPRPDLWTGASEELARLRNEVDPDVLARALRVVMRTAAIETGAIEGLYSTDRGLTITVATQAALWETQLSEKGIEAVALFEAQLRTYQLVLDAATEGTPVTEVLIRRFHEELTGPQETYEVVTPQGVQPQPLPKGEYKKHPNHVKLPDGTIHAYAPVDMTRPEMERLVSNVGSKAFRGAHPAIQASYAHYVLAAVHPFADGNGRVARALASIYFYRAIGIPLLVLSDQRDEYFRALADADVGQPESFVEIIAEAGRSAMAMVAVTLEASLRPEPERTLVRFRELFTAQGDLTFHELDELAGQIGPRFITLVQERLASLAIPRGVQIEPVNGAGRQPGRIHEPNFRPIVTPHPLYAQLNFSTAPPAQLTMSVVLNVLVSTERDPARTIRLEDEETGFGITFALADLYPAMSVGADYRLGTFGEAVLSQGLGALFEAAEEQFRSSPYGG